MRRDVLVSVSLLLAAVAVWAVLGVRNEGAKKDADARRLQTLEAEIAAERAKVRSLEAEVAELRGGAAEARTPRLQAAVRSSTPPVPQPSKPPTPLAPAFLDAKGIEQVMEWKADALQIVDPDRRDRALEAIREAIGSPEPAMAAAALRLLYIDLRDVAHDRNYFRDAVITRLEDEDPQVRSVAAFAFLHVAREEGDADRLMDIAERSASPVADPLLRVAARLSNNRVEGRLAALYVAALATQDPKSALSVASDLRAVWVAPEVEDAFLAAWRRNRDGGHLLDLAQIQPVREARVRMIFEIMDRDDTSAPQILKVALESRSLDPTARPLAASLALERLPTASNAMMRYVLLRVLRENGTAEQAAAVRAYARNPMLGESLRKEAEEVAAVLERRSVR